MKTILIVGNEIATQALSRDFSLMSVFGSIHESMKPKSAFLTCFSAWMVIFFKILWSGLFACIGWFLLPANQTSWLVLKGNFGRKQIAIFQASVSDGKLLNEVVLLVRWWCRSRYSPFEWRTSSIFSRVFQYWVICHRKLFVGLTNKRCHNYLPWDQISSVTLFSHQYLGVWGIIVFGDDPDTFGLASQWYLLFWRCHFHNDSRFLQDSCFLTLFDISVRSYSDYFHVSEFCLRFHRCVATDLVSILTADAFTVKSGM